VDAFYFSAGEFAKKSGTVINVLSIKGTDCSLENLAKVAAVSRGYNNIVDPLSLMKDFNSILANKFVASEVIVKMLVHKGFVIIHEDGTEQSKTYKDIGNVVKESAVSFEFGQSRDANELRHQGDLPFQVQINYTKLDGSKCIRVMTQTRKITNERKVAEEKINVHVVGLHAVQQSAKLAQEGNYTKARMKQITAQKMIKRAVESSSVPAEQKAKQKREMMLFEEEAKKIDDALVETQKDEREVGYNYDSASDDDSDDEKKKRKTVTSTNKAARSKARKGKRTDMLSNALYQQENPMYSGFM